MATMPVAGTKARPVRRRAWRQHVHWIYPLLVLVVGVVLWQVIVDAFDTPTYLVPSPTEVWASMRDNSDRLWSNGVTTTVDTLIGFGIAIAIGIPLAVAIVYSRAFERAIYPLLVASQTVPKIAVAPLFIVWFGFGSTPKIINAALIAFFPIVISAVVGLQSVQPDMIKLLRSMGASNREQFTKVRLPNAMPGIFSGIKVGVTLAVVGTIVGEFVGSNSGLGYLLLVASGKLDTPLVFADIVVLTFIGVVLFYIVEIIESRATAWHERPRLQDPGAATM
jgi:NitT/TauT family transport system permease protein